MEAAGSVDFNDIFAGAQSAPAHQIGYCEVEDDRVFVEVGDGGNTTVPGDLDVLLGDRLAHG